MNAGDGIADAAFGLHRFDDEPRRHARRSSRAAATVVERQQADLGQQRLERRAIHGIAADRERAPRVAVKATLERHERGTASHLPRRLERAVDRLGAARREYVTDSDGGRSDASRAASRTCGSCTNSPYTITWRCRSICARAAATTSGCPWPTFATPMPARRSSHARPWSSHTVAPDARATTSPPIGESEVWQTCRRKSADSSSLTIRPGYAVRSRRGRASRADAAVLGANRCEGAACGQPGRCATRRGPGRSSC